MNTTQADILIGQIRPETKQEKHDYESFKMFRSYAYLQEYYSEVDYENDELLKFYSESYQQIPFVGNLLEFSGGATIYSLITASTKATEIHFSDYLTDNRQQVKKWIHNHKQAFPWDHFIRRALQHEGLGTVTDEHIHGRKSIIREKIKKVVKSNAFRKFSLRHNNNQQYDTVNVNFVPESITSQRDEWEKALMNIFSLVKPGGHLILTSIKKSEYYILEGKKFPAVQIYEKDIIEILQKNNFDMDTLYMRSIEAKPYRGYEGMIFIKIRKALDVPLSTSLH